MEPIPKFIDPRKCRRCGNCQLGCKYNARWTAVDFLESAEKSGAECIYNAEVDKIRIENGTVRGLSCTVSGKRQNLTASRVILCAGGLGSPVILQKSGMAEAGKGLFMDLFINVFGTIENSGQGHEPPMTLINSEFYQDKGFILSPFINYSRVVRFIEMGIKGAAMPSSKIIGLMVKTRDDASGEVFVNGKITKAVSPDDWIRLNDGAAMAKEILIRAGADSHSIQVSKVQGAHPGGTAAIGKVVNKDLRTRVENLYICDASVLPVAPGLPPILTIVALAKRLSKILAA